MVRLKLTLAYKGTRFKGWQIQARQRATPERTVQGVLEEAFFGLVGMETRVHGAGRTDSGVHALGQVAHADVPREKMRIDWQRALNSQLPGDLSVIRVEEVPDDFHARFSAQGKTYAYHLWLSRRFVLPQRSHYVWPVGPLNLQAMDEASRLLLGEHDFSAFRNQGSDVESTVRTLLSVTRSPESEPPELCPEMVLRFTASGFLKQMVRNLVGCLVDVGRGALLPKDIPALLEQGDRSLAPATAPAKGLTLEQVEY